MATGAGVDLTAGGSGAEGSTGLVLIDTGGGAGLFIAAVDKRAGLTTGGGTDLATGGGVGLLAIGGGTDLVAGGGVGLVNLGGIGMATSVDAASAGFGFRGGGGCLVRLDAGLFPVV